MRKSILFAFIFAMSWLPPASGQTMPILDEIGIHIGDVVPAGDGKIDLPASLPLHFVSREHYTEVDVDESNRVVSIHIPIVDLPYIVIKRLGVNYMNTESAERRAFFACFADMRKVTDDVYIDRQNHVWYLQSQGAGYVVSVFTHDLAVNYHVVTKDEAYQSSQ